MARESTAVGRTLHRSQTDARLRIRSRTCWLAGLPLSFLRATLPTHESHESCHHFSARELRARPRRPPPPPYPHPTWGRHLQLTDAHSGPPSPHFPRDSLLLGALKALTGPPHACHPADATPTWHLPHCEAHDSGSTGERRHRPAHRLALPRPPVAHNAPCRRPLHR